jgi:branched-chain amino acid transport system permease protein
MTRSPDSLIPFDVGQPAPEKRDDKAFMAVGAYTSAILAARWGLPFWICLPCAGMAAGLIGIVFGLPSLKVKGFYLALTTIAAQFIIIYLIKTPFPEVTGGAIALHVPEVRLGGWVFKTERQLYYLVMAFSVLMTFFCQEPDPEPHRPGFCG